MQVLALLPLANGTFTSFGNQYSNSVYLCTAQCPRYLLPNLEGELVDNGIEREIYNKLKATADGGAQTEGSAVNAGPHCSRAVPQEWQYQNCVPLSHLTLTWRGLKDSGGGSGEFVPFLKPTVGSSI